MLIYRPEKLPAYFVTAAKTGVRANLPLLERIKVYKIAPDFSETIQIDKINDRTFLEEKALSLEAIKNRVEGKTIRKVIAVPGKLVNIVAS